MKHAGNQGGRPRNRTLVELGMLAKITGNDVKLTFATRYQAFKFIKAIYHAAYLKSLSATLDGRQVTVRQRTRQKPIVCVLGASCEGLL